MLMADETYLDHLSRLEQLRQSRDPRERLRQVHAERRLAEFPEIADLPPGIVANQYSLRAPTLWERLTTPLLDKPAQPGPAILHHLSAPLDIATTLLTGVGGITPKRQLIPLIRQWLQKRGVPIRVEPLRRGYRAVAGEAGTDPRAWEWDMTLQKPWAEKSIFKYERQPDGSLFPRQTWGPRPAPHWTEGLTEKEIEDQVWRWRVARVPTPQTYGPLSRSK